MDDILRNLQEFSLGLASRNIVVQKKFERTTVKIISDALSRVSNNLCKTRVLALHLDIINNGTAFNGINVSTKLRPNQNFPEQLRCELNRIIQYLNGKGECFINTEIAL